MSHRAAPSRAPAQARTAPPWRALLALAALVLAVHALVLQSKPQRFGPELDPSALTPAKAFVTRRIEAAPPAEVVEPAPVTAAPAKPAAKAAEKPVKKPVLEQKEALAQQPRAQPAIELIAPETPPQPKAPEQPTAPASDSVPAAAAASATAIGPDTTASAPPPAPAASAPAAPPAGPSQTPVTAMALAPSARLAYAMTGSAKGLNYHANAELVWNNAGSNYDARMTVSALFLGSRSLSSRGQLSDQGLAPQRFSDKAKSEVAAHFEPDKNQISFSANTPTLPWIKGAQDRVSVFLQLGGMLAGNPAGFPLGASISLYTVGPRDADTWTFRVEAEESLTLPFGALNTIKLSRQPRREFDQKVEIWFAPSLGYLPVRSKITQHNGDFVDQQLETLNKP